MSKRDGILELSYGICAEPLSKQILNEGYKLPKSIKYFDTCLESVKQLKFILPDSVNDRVVSALNRKVVEAVRKANA